MLSFIAQTITGQEKKLLNLKQEIEVELKITELDLNDRKIKGSLKALRKSPWEHAMEEYKVGTTVERK